MDGAHGPLDLPGGDDGGAQLPRERQRGGMAHVGENAQSPGVLIDPEDPALETVRLQDRDRQVRPHRMPSQQQLEGQRPDINAGHPVHGRPPDVATGLPPACP